MFRVGVRELTHSLTHSLTVFEIRRPGGEGGREGEDRMYTAGYQRETFHDPEGSAPFMIYRPPLLQGATPLLLLLVPYVLDGGN